MIIKKFITISLLCTIFFSCTEKFYPEIDGDVSILVVDGKITDEIEPCEVRLFRTVSFADSFPLKPERNALVILHDDLNKTEILSETEPGIYKSSFTTIKGKVGRSYWIEIQTLSGDKYESTPELMLPPFEITSLYGDEMEVITDDNTEEAVGIYFDAKNNENIGSYLRWEYQESYEWHTPFEVDTKFTENPQTVCYPVNDFPIINLYDASDIENREVNHLLTSTILKHEVKLKHKYLLDMRLYSVSQENFIFWKNMKAIHQTNGNLYDILPANIKGNISTCEGDCEVLGYFEVSSVRTKKGIFSKDDYSVKFSDFPKECETFIYITVPDNSPPDLTRYFIERVIIRPRLTVYEARFRHCYECNQKYPTKKPSFWP
ncbi:DUF4249 domain-containing protein [Ancylomarina sp. YFZ004]